MILKEKTKMNWLSIYWLVVLEIGLVYLTCFMGTQADHWWGIATLIVSVAIGFLNLVLIIAGVASELDS